MAQTKITLTHDKETTQDLVLALKTGISGNDNTAYKKVIDMLGAISGGIRNGSMDVQISGDSSTYASGTLTLASVVATNSCSINGVTFTAVASGATGNQFNVGGNDTITAANLAAAINASATALVTGVVTATSSGAVVTVTAHEMGLTGNCILLAGGTNITASGARLTGGTYTSNVVKNGI